MPANTLYINLYPPTSDRIKPKERNKHNNFDLRNGRKTVVVLAV